MKSSDKLLTVSDRNKPKNHLSARQVNLEIYLSTRNWTCPDLYWQAEVKMQVFRENKQKRLILNENNHTLSTARATRELIAKGSSDLNCKM